MRLDKYLANHGPWSRREIKRLVRQGLVSLDGKAVTDAGMHIEEEANIAVEGEPLGPPPPGYLMFHKPVGVVCANSDNLHPTVFDHLPEDFSSRMHIAGRLDLDTTGLVLLTDNGQWSHRITSPRSECPKLYQVVLQHPLTDQMQRQLERGVFLHEEKRRTAPARVERIADDEILLTIHEGKYHQVKRMLIAVENEVIELHRCAIGNIQLDENLAPGEYRELSEEEIAHVCD